MLRISARAAAWGGVAALWLAETVQAAGDPRLLGPSCAGLLHLATATATITVLLRHYARPQAELERQHDRRVTSLTDFVAVLGKRAGVEAPDAAPTAPMAALKLVDREESAS